MSTPEMPNINSDVNPQTSPNSLTPEHVSPRSVVTQETTEIVSQWRSSLGGIQNSGNQILVNGEEGEESQTRGLRDLALGALTLAYHYTSTAVAKEVLDLGKKHNVIKFEELSSSHKIHWPGVFQLLTNLARKSKHTNR